MFNKYYSHFYHNSLIINKHSSIITIYFTIHSIQANPKGENSRLQDFKYFQSLRLKEKQRTPDCRTPRNSKRFRGTPNASGVLYSRGKQWTAGLQGIGVRYFSLVNHHLSLLLSTDEGTFLSVTSLLSRQHGHHVGPSGL